MSHVIKLSIPIYDTMLCLAYSGPCQRLLEAFPGAIIADEWCETSEYRRLVEFLRDRSDSEQTHETMKAQMRSKQISHGPSLRFRLPEHDGMEGITGILYRWGITFRSETAFSETTQGAIEAFLKSFTIGTVESYTEG